MVLPEAEISEICAEADISRVGNSENAYVSVHLAATGIDLLTWLEANSEEKSFYWKNRTGDFEIAAIGCSKSFQREAFNTRREFFNNVQNELESLSSSSPVRAVGVSSFFEENEDSGIWENASADLWYIPEILLERVNNQIRIQYFLSAPNSLEVEINKIIDSLYGLKWKEIHKKLPDLNSRKDSPNKNEWRTVLNDLLSEIESGALSKTVLARQTDLTFASKLNAYDLLRAVNDISKPQYRYIIKPNPKISFIGVSPECLVSIKNNDVCVDALGGTVAYNPALNGIIRQELHSDKNTREHDFVRNEIHEKLNKLCVSDIRSDNSDDLLLSSVMHLHTNFSGRFGSEYSLGKVIETLHPTSAVGGVPSYEALTFIKEHEQFDRGWYAGFLGVISGDFTELTVGIRSALLSDNKLSLFSGAGIVKGSDADQEWQELEDKITSFTRLFA